MKIDNVTLVSSSGNREISIPLRDPTSAEKYKVKTIYGLDSGAITTRYYGRLGGNAKAYDLTTLKRDISIRLGLNPNYNGSGTHSSLRDSLYRMISDDRTGKVMVHLKNQNTTQATTSGFVTRLETTHFTEDPEAQITISCENGLFVSPTNVTVPANDRSNPEHIVVNNTLGTAPSGVILTVRPNVPIIPFEVTDPGGTWFFRINHAFTTDRSIVIDSNPGQLFAGTQIFASRLNRGLAIHPGSMWPMIFPGENHFKFEGDVEVRGIEYRPAFWGV